MTANLDPSAATAAANATSSQLLQRAGYLPAVLVLLLCLIATGLAWSLAKKQLEEKLLLRFVQETARLQFEVNDRLLAYEDILRGAQALFVANSNKVSREQWRSYVETIKLYERFRGVQSVSFSLRIAASERAAHVAEMRAQGFTRYDIHPAGEREDYHPVVYLEPFSGNNLRAFGYDTFFEAERKKAITRAWDTGLPSMSGKIRLVQEADKSIQYSFLVSLPVYRGATVPQTAAERRAAPYGFVHIPFRMADFMRMVLRNQPQPVTFQIFEGRELTADALVYDGFRAETTAPNNYTPRFSKIASFDFAGRTWSLNFRTTAAFESAIDHSQPILAAVSGAAISLILFAVTWALARKRGQALALADDRTKELRESREQFQAVAESATGAVISNDAWGNITYVNEAATQLFGYRRDELLGAPITLLVPQRFHELTRQNLENFRAGKPFELLGKTTEISLLRKDGTQFFGELALARWETKAGAFLTGIFHDITARKKSEAELAARNRDLETLLYVTSHDLREPLRAIENFSHMTQERYSSLLDDRGRDYLQRVVRAARRMDDLLRDIVTLSRVQRTQLAQLQIDGTVIVHDALARLDETVRQRTAKIRVENGLPQLCVDRTWATQAIYNLIANALKFTRDGEPPDIEIGPHVYTAAPNVVAIAVRDRGPGVDPEHAERIFDLFQRAVGREVDGTGAGLAIVRQVAQRHGGQAWVQPRPGGGSEFVISFTGSPTSMETRDGTEPVDNTAG